MKSPLIFVLASLLFISFHGLFYKRVIEKLLVSKSIKNALAIFVAINLILNILYIVSRYTNIISNALHYIFSISIGITFVMLMYLILHEVLHLFHTRLKYVDQSKRNFIKKSGDGLMLAASAGYVTTAAYEGSKEPVVNVIKIGRFDFSIVQISDLHIGGLIDQEFVKHSVEKINALHPDLVFITGDFIDTEVESVSDIVRELDNIKAKYGIYGVLGNHEYFHKPLEIIEFMKKTKIKLLLNDNIIIPELKVNIVGVNDLFGYRIGMLEPNIHKAYQNINSEYKTILLAHQPKFIEQLGHYTPDLILSGHTHGGQIYPFKHLVKLQQPFVKGLHILPNNSAIYVNSGIGFWGPPMRLGSQAEIAYLI
jgi:hypothetical protein